MEKIWGFQNELYTYQCNIFKIEKDILLIKHIGIIEKESYETVVDFIYDYSKNLNNKVNLIVDGSNTKKIHPQARKIVLKLHGSKAPTKRVALIGLNPMLRALANLARSLIAIKKLKVFTSIEKALEWIKNK